MKRNEYLLSTSVATAMESATIAPSFILMLISVSLSRYVDDLLSPPRQVEREARGLIGMSLISTGSEAEEMMFF